MLVCFARAKGMVPFKSILACDLLPISPISFGRFLNSEAQTKCKRGDGLDDGCSHG